MNTSIPPSIRERTLKATHTTETGAVLPAYLRLPAPGRSCPISGLRRGMLYQLVTEGKVKSAVLKRKKSTRGVRLIATSSLLAYIASCEVASDQVPQDEHELVED